MQQAAKKIIEEINFNSQEFADNPYPTYRYLQEMEKPYWHSHIQSNSTSQGMWLFTKYRHVTEVLKESNTVSKQVLRVRAPENITMMDYNMINQDPPDHTRLRKLVNKAFSPEQIKNLAPRIEKIVDDLIIKIKQNKQPDFVEDFARPLPMIIIADFLGVPFEDHIAFCKWSSQILRGYDSGVDSTDNFVSYRGAIKEMSDYFSDMIEKRRKNPSNDLISLLAEAHDNEDRLNSAELISMCNLLLISGHETTTNMISAGLLTLLSNPDQFQLLKENPELLPSAVEEILRYESPIQRATFRITTKECILGGHQLKEGEQLAAVIGAANRDPEYFENPDKFDITRSPNRHIAFGVGIHFCLGTFLAKTEANIGFGKLIKEFPNMKLANDTPKWNDRKLFRALTSLPILI